jgi:uncharacterized membrane protein
MDAQLTSATDAYHLLMATFREKEAAARTLDRLRSEGALEGCEIEGEALVWRDPDGNVHVQEKGSAGIGATFGAAAGGLVGLVTGPVGLLLMVVGGALAGGVAGHFAGQAIPVADLREIGESLAPGSSAYIAVVDGVHADELSRVLEESGARVLNAAVETELSSVLREAVTKRITRA